LRQPHRNRARSPPGVPPRHLRRRPNATAQLQLTHFLGRNELGAGVTRALPSQCSGFYPAGRSSCRPGVLARSRPGAEVTSRRSREPHSPRPPESPAGVPYLRGRDDSETV
jgi:hypothetical protein